MRSETKITDLHAHILPCADHGSDSLDMSLRQMALINNAGVNTVVATPHFYPNLHTVDEFVSAVSSAADELISASPMPRPELCIGAEVLYTDGIDSMDGLSKLCIRGTDILLLELPLADLDKSVIYSVKRLTGEYRVVLAHIDRYMTLFPDIIDTLLSLGAVAQINSSALFCRTVKRRLMPYISDGRVVAIGSDLHTVDKRSYTKFSKARSKLGDEFDRIMERTDRLLCDAIRY